MHNERRGGWDSSDSILRRKFDEFRKKLKTCNICHCLVMRKNMEGHLQAVHNDVILQGWLEDDDSPSGLERWIADEGSDTPVLNGECEYCGEEMTYTEFIEHVDECVEAPDNG